MSICPSLTKFFRTHKFLLLLGAGFFSVTWVTCAFVHVWYRQKIFIVGQQIRVLEKEVIELQRRESILRIKVAQLHDPTLLKRYAYNLHEPRRDHVFYVAMHALRANQMSVAQEFVASQNHPGKHIFLQKINLGKDSTTDSHF
ncbi:MAG: hypothetical protein LBI34_01280 [Puniceicoccales bacterium]|jgi:hypothetical protein|nr:hypothetical protein [Puniceicoccales bacterium]